MSRIKFRIILYWSISELVNILTVKKFLVYRIFIESYFGMSVCLMIPSTKIPFMECVCVWRVDPISCNSVVNVAS